MRILITVFILLSAHARSYTKTGESLSQPQISFLRGSIEPRTAKISNSETKYTLETKKTVMYTIDQEIHYSPYMNIGFGLRWLNGDAYLEELELDSFEINASMGPFVRLQYPMLNHRLSFFLKSDLQLGIFIFGFSGIAAYPAVSGGMEYYFSEFFGLTAGYTYSYHYGVETLASRVEEVKDKTKGETLYYQSQSQGLYVGIKSTYF